MVSQPSTLPGDSGQNQTLSAPTERVTERQAEQLASEHYGLLGRARQLDGERDGNFEIATSAGRFMLKVVHSSERRAVTECQTTVLTHLESVAPELPVPRIVRARSGESFVVPDSGPVAGRAIRVITFVEGRPLHGVRTSAELRRNLGRASAALGAALSSFDHPATTEPILWDLAHLTDLRPLIGELASTEHRGRLSALVDRFETTVRPSLSRQRKQVVHNDFSGDNILIGADGVSVSGILDFGDMVRTELINDVAVAAAYQLSDSDDPTDTVVDLVQGYQQITPLRAEELDLLLELIVARTVVRLTITEWRAARFPENATYILRNTPRTWSQLDTLLHTPGDDFKNRITT